MRLNAESVICTKDREWYYGSLSGFTFYFKSKITDKNFFKDPYRFKTAAQWIKELGYQHQFSKLTKTLLKSIQIKNLIDKNSKLNSQKGVRRLFIGKTVNIGLYDYKKDNFLCANCMYTCKQPKYTIVVKCKAFKNGSPV